MGLKSFSPDQPSGRTGSGSEICTAAMVGVVGVRGLCEVRYFLLGEV
jgi:hypothetical protein